MEVTESEARKILKGMGFENAECYSNEVLTVKLNNLEMILNSGYKIPTEEKALRLFRLVSRAIQEGESITVSTEMKEAPVEKKTKSKKSAENGRKERGPGVVKTIVGLLTKASERRPITKEDILQKLVEEFPDRKADAMKSTVSQQVSYHLRKKGVAICKNDKGFWIQG